MPATSQKQARYFRWLEHAPDAAAEREKSGMSHQQLHDFASTPDKGLPERAPKHLANGGTIGGTMASNQTFQEGETTMSKKRPEWMERAQKQTPAIPKKNVPMMADGGKFRVKRDTPAPEDRTAPHRYYGQGPMPAMADGKNWMESAFGSNKGGLHRATKTPAGQKIPASKVHAMAAHGTEHQKKMANAAINANPSRY